MGWLFLLHPRIGIVNQFLQDMFGFADAPLSITTITGMGWVQGLNLTPVAFIMTAGAFRAMDPKLEEAAEASGASTARIIWSVTVPLIWPGILAAGMYILLSDFRPSTCRRSSAGPTAFLPSAPTVLDGQPPGRSAALWLERDLQHHRHRSRGGSRLVVRKGAKSQSPDEVITGKAYQPKIIKLGNRTILAWLFVSTYLFLSKLIPLAMLLWASLLRYFEMPSVDALGRTSLQNYLGLPWELVLRGAGNTSILMLLTPTITVMVSLIFAWVVLRSRIRGRFLFDFFAFLPHAVPNIIFAIGAVLLALFVLRGFIPLYGTIWLLLLLYIIVRLSYGTRMMNSR